MASASTAGQPPVQPAGDPFCPDTPRKLVRRAFTIPSPKKLLFGVFSTNTPVPTDSSARPKHSVMPVRELVAPGVSRCDWTPYSLTAPAPCSVPAVTMEEVLDDEDGSVRRLARSGATDTLLDLADSDSDASDASDDHAADMRLPPPSTPLTSPSLLDLRDGALRAAPTIEAASSALDDLQLRFRKRRPNGKGWIALDMDAFERDRLVGMRTMLHFYVDKLSKTYGHWGASSLQAAVSMGRGQYCARVLRQMVRAFIANRSVLPVNPYGNWRTSMLCDQDLANDIMLYLQELGDGISAAKVAAYLNRPDVKAKHGISKTISERTARRWLRTLGYRYRYETHGQYVDGHERRDVVWYRAKVYIPALKSVSRSTESCDPSPLAYLT